MDIREPKPREMQDEQVGKILRLSDECGEWDQGMEFVSQIHSRLEADAYIASLIVRIQTQRPLAFMTSEATAETFVEKENGSLFATEEVTAMEDAIQNLLDEHAMNMDVIRETLEELTEVQRRNLFEPYCHCGQKATGARCSCTYED